VSFENDCYLLNPDVDIWLDFEEFEAHMRAARRLEAAGQIPAAMAQYGIADSLYIGDFLQEDLYDDWPSVQREQLRSVYLEGADHLSQYYVDRSEYAAAITLCQKILAVDRCCEEAHRRLMQCYTAQGQRHLAVHQYQVCIQTMREELDLEPSQETQALYRRMTGCA
jgi:DNA-binding SARP family transcriptional activator